ncbi:MAG TPA: PQQ-binding-like beta-propeller repeat protein [Steroidobacteraceae bacterium]|jgi:PQQ-dependent dehydrogenase (methanol/ethanol family)|nr:PQQ-binding-like beta-propeller repeat protein [Steroidobacteraceae bacterium]
MNKKIAGPAAIAGVLLAPALLHAATAVQDWPSYNKTLTSERFGLVDAIDSHSVAGLKVRCSFDVGEPSAFETGLIEVEGVLFATTEHDTIAIDANDCKQIWRAHGDFPSGVGNANRGVAFLDGAVFRGTPDGRVISYSAKTGKAGWSTVIADPAKGESVPAAPIAWHGLVFAGNAGGDSKGVKGRLYALDAATGRIVWEQYLVPKDAADAPRGPQAPVPAPLKESTWHNAKGIPVTGGTTWTSYSLDPTSGLLYVPVSNAGPAFAPSVRSGDDLFASSIVVLDAKTGAYHGHFQLGKHDSHQWDVSSAPVLFRNRKGRHMLAEAPKDGYLYLIDLESGATIFRKPVTTVQNADAPITAQGTRFCPGTGGGAEWNGAGVDPGNNLLFTGEVDWCTTVRAAPIASLGQTPTGKLWTGATDPFGKQDDPKRWGGWLTATDIATGERKWRFRTPYPIVGGVTATIGRLLLFGDIGGNFYAFDPLTGKKLWSAALGGAIGGGVITYDSGEGQRIAVAAGMTSESWHVPKTNAKIVVLGL